MCIHQLFEKCASINPESPALIKGSECLTYAQLDVASSRLALKLQASGVGPETIVGLYFERSIELIVAILAVLKAGGAYLPLDPAIPAARLSFMLQEVEAPLVLTQRHLETLVPEGALRSSVVDLDELKRETGALTPQVVDPASLAYVIYTSGSTGKPKGVLIEHRSIANYIAAVIEAYEVHPDDRVLQLSALSFDASVEEMFIALCSGATLVLRDDEMISSVANFMQKCAEQRISVVGCPTAFWHELVNLMEAQELPLPPTLRTIIIGGEQASAERWKVWRKHAAEKVRLFNSYGPTETTIVATLFQIPHDWHGGHVPIGQPVRGMSVRLLGADLQEVKQGEEGELYIGGIGVARGYLKRPELNAAKFISDPNDDSRRWYKTGDLVRCLPDGNLVFIGRIDHQVKIGGFRVELSEIEIALEKHSHVQQAVVLAREDKPGTKQLVAYVVLTSDTRPEQLQGFLRRHLPHYMVPGRFVFLEKLPVTANGKVDRRALPTPSNAREKSGPLAWKPRNPIELQLQLTFARFFNRHDIGPDTSFFELGGDSLQALRIIVELERAVGKKLPLGILFRAPTIKELAQAISKELVAPEVSSLVPLQPHGARAPLFLVHTTPGDVLGYGNLVYHFPSDQPCYGFQSVGLLSPECAHETIEQMAAHYNGLMRSVQPHGPYHLGGWCYGGIVAMEMAQQLKREGEEVGLLVLMETPAPPPESHRLKYNLVRAANLLFRSPRVLCRYLGAKLQYYRTNGASNELRFQHSRERWEGEEQGYYEKLKLLYDRNMAAVDKYRSRPYDGRILLLNAAERDPAVFPDRQFGWGPLVSEIEVREVPGQHDTILMEPYVAELAELLKEFLPEERKPSVIATSPKLFLSEKIAHYTLPLKRPGNVISRPQELAIAPR